MILYCVFAIEFHVGETLLGIYDSQELAEHRILSFDNDGYDEIKIKEIELNNDLE